MNIPDGFFEQPCFSQSTLICFQLWALQFTLQRLHVATPAIVDTSIVVLSRCVTRVNFLTAAMSFPL